MDIRTESKTSKKGLEPREKASLLGVFLSYISTIPLVVYIVSNTTDNLLVCLTIVSLLLMIYFAVVDIISTLTAFSRFKKSDSGMLSFDIDAFSQVYAITFLAVAAAAELFFDSTPYAGGDFIVFSALLAISSFFKNIIFSKNLVTYVPAKEADETKEHLLLKKAKKVNDTLKSISLHNYSRAKSLSLSTVANIENIVGYIENNVDNEDTVHSSLVELEILCEEIDSLLNKVILLPQYEQKKHSNKVESVIRVFSDLAQSVSDEIEDRKEIEVNLEFDVMKQGYSL